MSGAVPMTQGKVVVRSNRVCAVIFQDNIDTGSSIALRNGLSCAFYVSLFGAARQIIPDFKHSAASGERSGISRYLKLRF